MNQGPSLRSLLLAAVAGTILLVVGVLLVPYLASGGGGAAGSVPILPLVLGTVAVLVTALLSAGHLLQSHVLSRLAEIAETAERIADGELERRIEPEGARELRRLARSVNRMADRLIRERRLLAENVESLEETNRLLVEARDELVRAEKLASVGRLASGLAHEIGNPLNAIMTYVEVGRRRGHEGDWLEGLEHEARRIDRIITGLLNYARPGDDEEQVLDVNEIARATVDLLESQGQLTEVTVDVRLDPELPPVTGSPDQLQHVLINLLLNACDAMEEADPEPGEESRVEVRSGRERFEGAPGQETRPRRDDDPEEVDYSHLRRLQRGPGSRIDHRLEPGQEVIVLEVLDTGPGLQQDDPESTVFDPFFTTKEPGRGTGLGLTVSASFVSSMGGVIEASNREDRRGASFRVLLPIDAPPGDRPPNHDDSGGAGDPSGEET